METPVRRKSWFVGLALGTLLALVIWPSTRWLIRAQLGLALPVGSAVTAYNSAGFVGWRGGSEGTDRQLDETAARHPDDYPVQLARAIQRRSGEQDSQPALERLRAVTARFSNSPSALANYLRHATTAAIRLNRTEDGGLPGHPNEHPPQAPKPGSNTPELLAYYDQLAAEGEGLEPDNAYFPFMRAIGLFASHKDAEALEAIHRAAERPHWEEYYGDEVEGALRLHVEAFGEPGGLVRTAYAAAILFPHYSSLRSTARVALYKAVEAEKAGHIDEGLAIRRDILQCGSRMRIQARTLIGNLVGFSISSISISSPGGETPPKLSAELTLEQKSQARLDAWEAYLKRVKHAEEIVAFRTEIEEGIRTRTLARRVSQFSPFDQVVSLYGWWMACLLTLGAALWMLVLAGSAACAGNSRRIQQGRPLPEFAGRGLAFGIPAGIVVTVALLVPDLPSVELLWAFSGVLAGAMLLLQSTGSRGRLRSLGVFSLGVLGVLLVGCMVRWQAIHGIEALNIYVTLYSGEGQTASSDMRTALFLWTGLLCLVPILTLFVAAVCSRAFRVPLSVGITRGLRGFALPIACILLLAYSGLVVMTLRQERNLQVGIEGTMQNEGRYLAGLAGQEWPGHAR